MPRKTLEVTVESKILIWAILISTIKAKIEYK